jgi:hypothetical protein
MSAAPPPPPPSPARRRAVTFLAALLWPAVLIEYLLILPGYDKQFREYGLKIDDLTGMVLNVSAWLRARTFLAFAITFVLMAITVGTAHAVQSASLSRRRQAAFLLFAFGVPFLLFLLTWLTVDHTHRTLVEGLKK